MFMDREAFIHFIGGAAGGTAGTAITCPLEVVKTRMQSSNGIKHLFGNSPSTSGPGPSQPSKPSQNNLKFIKTSLNHNNRLGSSFSVENVLSRNPLKSPFVSPLLQASRAVSTTSDGKVVNKRFFVFRIFAQIVRTEGIAALYKGLIPNLIGVAPSKAVYFFSYSSSKRFWNEADLFVPNSAIVHMVSAGSAGFVAASAVNPIWLVKTRLQLDNTKVGIWEMSKRVYKNEGIKGFYKGVTASYAGVSETMIQFCIYEYFRTLLMATTDETDKRKMDFLNFMVAGGSAKFFACVIAYPHEVVRTRLREEQRETKGFFRTLYGLYNEGYRAMYRGLSVQLMRTVPNTAITMGTYEFVVYMLHSM